jgi:hypothetical protein
VAIRQCPHCGKEISDRHVQCPYCREDVASGETTRSYNPMAGRTQIRRGLLYMWLAGIFYYFAAGYSGLALPFATPNVATEYLLPFLFLAGLGLVIAGLFQKMRG